jgi:large subunit ribosomal protein L22
MEAKAHSKQRYILMSHRKLRRVANEIRGKSVPEALNILRFMPYFASKVIFHHLVAAVSNYRENYKVDEPEKLLVSTILVDEGPAQKRFKPRAQGRIYKIEKPSAHLFVEVQRNAKV